jgi:hypothetical protein
VRKRLENVKVGDETQILTQFIEERVFAVPVVTKHVYQSLNGVLYHVRAGSADIVGDPIAILTELQRRALVLDKRRAPDVLAAILTHYNGLVTWAPPAVGVYAKDGVLHVHIPADGPIAPPTPNKYAEDLYARLSATQEHDVEKAKRIWRKILDTVLVKQRFWFILGASVASALGYALRFPIRPIVALVGPHGAGKTTEATLAVNGLFGTPVFAADAVKSESRLNTMISASTAPFVIDEATHIPSSVLTALKAVTGGTAAKSFRKTTTQAVMESLPLSVPFLTLNDGAPWLESDAAITQARIILINYPSPPQPGTQEFDQAIRAGQELQLLLGQLMEYAPIGWAVLRKYLHGKKVNELREQLNDFALKLSESVVFKDARRATFYSATWLGIKLLSDFLGVAAPTLAEYVRYVRQLEVGTAATATLGDLDEFLALLPELPAPTHPKGYFIVTSSVLREANEKARQSALITFSSLRRLALALAAAYNLRTDEIGPKTVKLGGSAVKAVLVPTTLVLDSQVGEEEVSADTNSSTHTLQSLSTADAAMALAKELEKDFDAFTAEDFIARAKSYGYEEKDAKNMLAHLVDAGLLYQPRPHVYRVNGGGIRA